MTVGLTQTLGPVTTYNEVNTWVIQGEYKTLKFP